MDKKEYQRQSRIVGWTVVGRWELGLRIDFEEWHDVRIEEWITTF